jgi:hypothetical protein
LLQEATSATRFLLFGDSRTALPAAWPRLEGRLGEAAARLLLQEALPSLAAACRSSPLPEEVGQIFQNFNVVSSGLGPALEREMAASDSELHLQRAAEVASALALGRPDGSTNAAEQVAAATIVATLCRSVCSPVRERSGSCPEAAARVDAALWQVLGLLPDVLAAVRAMAARGAPELAPGGLPPHPCICQHISGCLDEIVRAVEHLGRPLYYSIQSEEQLELWAAAADAALRTLPLLLESEAGWRQRWGGLYKGKLLNGFTEFVWVEGLAAAGFYLDSSPDDGDVEDSFETLWQLHSRACRYVHRMLPAGVSPAPGSASGQAGRSRQGGGREEGSVVDVGDSHWPDFEAGLHGLLRNCIASFQGFRALGLSPGLNPSLDSREQAVLAAHWAATRQLAGRTPLPPAAELRAAQGVSEAQQRVLDVVLQPRATALADLALRCPCAVLKDTAFVEVLRQAVEAVLAVSFAFECLEWLAPPQCPLQHRLATRPRATDPPSLAPLQDVEAAKCQAWVLDPLTAAAGASPALAAQMAAGGLLAVLLEAAAERRKATKVVSLNRAVGCRAKGAEALRTSGMCCAIQHSLLLSCRSDHVYPALLLCLAGSCLPPAR